MPSVSGPVLAQRCESQLDRNPGLNRLLVLGGDNGWNMVPKDQKRIPTPQLKQRERKKDHYQKRSGGDHTYDKLRKGTA